MGQELLLGMPLVEQEALGLVQPLFPLSAVVVVVVVAAAAAVGPPFAAVAGSVQKGYL